MSENQELKPYYCKNGRVYKQGESYPISAVDICVMLSTRTPSPTLRQIKSVEVVYRWYWFIKPKPKSSENKWVATCWQGSSEAEANEVASSDAYIADVGSRESKLVREETIFSVTDPSEELLSPPDRQLLRQAVEALESCKKWMKDEFIEAGEVKERIANIDETLSAIKQALHKAPVSN